VTVPECFDPATTDQWRYLATTNRKLESLAIAAVADLVGVDATVEYPGMIGFAADQSAVAELNRCSRSLHRLLLELARTPVQSLDDITDAVRELDVPAYLGPDQSFGVRARRRGEHPFDSMDVERAVGQAIIDQYRAQDGTRPPVDLDNPDVIFRLIVREEQARITIDTTGRQSLHRRWYRVREHEAPLRPTIAHAMLQLAEYDPTTRLVDPTCGFGTIPIEAALLARGRSPTADRDRPHTRLRFLNQTDKDTADCAAGPTGDPAVVAADVDPDAVAGARENARAAGVAEDLAFAQADARHLPFDGDALVADMPYGVRTTGEIRPLYAAISETIADGDWERVVLLTAREDLLDPAPTRSIPILRGRLEASILVFD